MAAITFPHLVCFQALLYYQTQSWIYQSFKKNKHWFSLVNITWVLMFTSSPTLEHSFRLKANRSLKEAVLWLNAYIWLSSVKLLQLNSYSSAWSGRCELSSSFNFRCWHIILSCKFDDPGVSLYFCIFCVQPHGDLGRALCEPQPHSQHVSVSVGPTKPGGPVGTSPCCRHSGCPVHLTLRSV